MNTESIHTTAHAVKSYVNDSLVDSTYHHPAWPDEPKCDGCDHWGDCSRCDLYGGKPTSHNGTCCRNPLYDEGGAF
jgi:hypothetical protein